MKTSLQLQIALLALAILAGPVWACPDCPTFTLRDVLSQSDTTMVIEIQSLDANTGIAVAKVTEVLKADANRPAVKEVKIDFLAMGPQLSEGGKMVIGWIQSGQTQAILFTGKQDLFAFYQEKPDDAGKGRAFLHLNGHWFILNEDPNGGPWEMEKMWEFLSGAWEGGTDMLLRCLKRIQADIDFDLPLSEGVQWDANAIARVGRVAGKVHSAMPVDLTGKGPADLFVASESGDRVFRWDGKRLVDVTAKLGLTSKSIVAAWGDYSGDGKLALASWDGKVLCLFSKKDDGTFAAKACDLGDAMKNGCLSLSTVDAGVKGKAGLLVGTRSWPVLLVPKGDGGFAAKSLGAGVQEANLGVPGACLVADFDGDGLIDVLQVFTWDSLLYRGTAPGALAAPVRTGIAAWQGRWGACLGDFDGDGLPDIFIAGENRNGLWQNLGGGKFADVTVYCGELTYISKSGGIATCCGDFNNDGTQDLLLIYGTKMTPQLFFNRGFRCFGLARNELDIVEHKAQLGELDKNLVADCSEPQQAGCLGDFNGDGALDLAVVLGNGDVVFFPRRVTPDSPAFGVNVSLPAGSPTAGPVSVSATYKNGRDLGSWLVRQGDGGTIIGTRNVGKVLLKWTLPDGKTQQKEVKVVGPIRVALDKQ